MLSRHAPMAPRASQYTQILGPILLRQRRQTPILALPVELLIQILRQLDLSSFLNLAMSCYCQLQFLVPDLVPYMTTDRLRYLIEGNTPWLISGFLTRNWPPGPEPIFPSFEHRVRFLSNFLARYPPEQPNRLLAVPTEINDMILEQLPQQDQFSVAVADWASLVSSNTVYPSDVHSLYGLYCAWEFSLRTRGTTD
ncbi:hypothetical protein BT63DRAFT_188202 [Microthyrium microscopicum]|uniref:F-box domain-containing protein n=1 Tax=Microthyrium microscopicum TaxID=703497 RepID=A0A6A6UK10_9PEZI|nr:hypothetical protein BT63DRAFT_188202 [Microthyrium microscopicum]